MLFLTFSLMLIIDSGFLILLVLRNQIVHVGLGLCEFHLVHTFSGVPMEESLSSKHSSELLTNSLEHFLNSSWVTNESGRHLQPIWRNVTNRGLDVVWNPFNKVRRVFVLYIKHLFVNFFSGDSSSKHSRSSQISTVSWVWGAHHILGVEHLLSQLSNI